MSTVSPVDTEARSLLFRPGGISMSLSFDRPLSQIDMGPAVYQFASETGAAEVSISLRYEPAIPPLGLDVRLCFDSECLWRLYRQGDDHLIALRLLDGSDQMYRLARFENDFSCGEIVSTLEGRFPTPHGRLPDPLEYPLGEAITMCFLGTGKGIMTHALGVEKNGRGYLFCGHSGNGKSTLAKLLSKTVRVLNDDRVVVRLVDGIPWIFGTPWHGDYSEVSRDGAPLAGIYFIEHGASNRVFDVGRATASAMLYARSFPAIWSKPANEFTLGFIDTITANVPCRRLAFVPSPAVAELLP